MGTPDENPHALAVQIALVTVTVVAAVAVTIVTRRRLGKAPASQADMPR